MRHVQSRPLILISVAVLGACAESPLGRLEHETDAGAVEVTETPDAAGGLTGSSVTTSLDGAAALGGGADAVSDAAADGAGDTVTSADGIEDAGALDFDGSLPGDPPSSMEAAVPMEAVPPSCEAPQRVCESRCVDMESDSQHCGACGNRCASDESCVQSQCLAEAPRDCTTQLFEERVYLFCAQARTWSAARRSCLEAGMDLTVVDSAEENDFVGTGAPPLWLGANDQQEERRWRVVPAGAADDVGGPALRYAPWAEGEPNNSVQCDGLSLGDRCLGDESDEDCAMMRADGRWNDAECDQRHRYVCEAY